MINILALGPIGGTFPLFRRSRHYWFRGKEYFKTNTDHQISPMSTGAISDISLVYFNNNEKKAAEIDASDETWDIGTLSPI